MRRKRMTKLAKSLSTDACKDRKQWSAAELCNCHTNYGKRNTKEKRSLVLNKKGKASTMDIKTTQYAMLLLYKYPLQKSTRTYCLSEMPMWGVQILAWGREGTGTLKGSWIKLGIFTPRPVGHPVYLKTMWKTCMQDLKKSKKMLYAFFPRLFLKP